MSVIVRHNRWANSRVPYVITPENPQVEGWFREVNVAVGFPLLARKLATDINHVELIIGGASKSEVIGCKGAGMQKIGGTSKHTVLHELLHAIGFKHEQLHRKLPWDDTDPRRTKVNRYAGFAPERGFKTEGNRKLFEAITVTVNEFYASNNLWSRLEAVMDPQTEHWGDCDLNSVMCYPDFVTALTRAGMDRSPGVTRSGMHPACDTLSNQDAQALRYMYPAPPLQLARKFRVTFQGLPGDSVMLDFQIREKSNPLRLSKYKADANGQKVVDGFNPDIAEICVAPWSTWSQVKVDPRTANALPGGRYIYSISDA